MRYKLAILRTYLSFFPLKTFKKVKIARKQSELREKSQNCDFIEFISRNSDFISRNNDFMTRNSDINSQL